MSQALKLSLYNHVFMRIGLAHCDVMLLDMGSLFPDITFMWMIPNLHILKKYYIEQRESKMLRNVVSKLSESTLFWFNIKD